MIDKLISIKNWLYHFGRPLDVLRYEYLFLKNNKDLYKKLLMTYQNPDGGFGHGIEPDSLNPNSSPIQTWMAFEMIEELELTNEDKIVKDVLNYLINLAPKKDGLYLSTIPTNNEFPHASWWSYAEESSVWGYNPTIAIAGFIYKYGLDKTQKDYAIKIIQRAINDFNKKPSEEMHELRAFLEMVSYVGDLSDFFESQIFLNNLEIQISNSIEKDSSLWFSTYCVRPLQYFDKPNGFAYKKHQNLAKKEASMILDSLNKKGYWEVTWQWSEYLEDWIISKQAWRSSLIIGYLKILTAYKIISFDDWRD
ncbi:MAG: hypothetical protein RBR66_03350 [Candidatus Izemoplasmatales bacterium]|nr:hypothetical protein [Candidatus Izemoplasmatales bacterium]